MHMSTVLMTRKCHTYLLSLAVPFFIVWALVNSIAWAYGSTQALPWGTVILLGSLWGFREYIYWNSTSIPIFFGKSHFRSAVGYPLTVLGGIFGKNWANGFDAPCRTKNIAREIPSVPWYRSTFAHCAVGGFLPFRYSL